MTVYRHPETGDRSIPAEPAFEELLMAQGYVPVEGDEANETEVERLRRENADLRKRDDATRQAEEKAMRLKAPKPAPERTEPLAGEPVGREVSPGVFEERPAKSSAYRPTPTAEKEAK